MVSCLDGNRVTGGWEFLGTSGWGLVTGKVRVRILRAVRRQAKGLRDPVFLPQAVYLLLDVHLHLLLDPLLVICYLLIYSIYLSC